MGAVAQFSGGGVIGSGGGVMVSGFGRGEIKRKGLFHLIFYHYNMIIKTKDRVL